MAIVIWKQEGPTFIGWISVHPLNQFLVLAEDGYG